MAIQSSVNALMQQLYTIGAIGAGLKQQREQTKGQEKTANEAQIQTEIAAGNAPMKNGKVDTEWLQKRRDEFDNSKIGKIQKQIFQNEINRNNDPSLADLLAKYNTKNEIASDLARASVEARTDSINKTKSNFDEHVASLIRYYGKGSGNP